MNYVNKQDWENPSDNCMCTMKQLIGSYLYGDIWYIPNLRKPEVLDKRV
jgi:hypothetical protein